MKAQTIITVFSCVILLLIGFFIGFAWGSYSNYHLVVEPDKGRTGYTVIDHDSVEWSDGKREKYNWHVHTRKHKAK